MSDITALADLRPLVGSPNFMPALLAYIRKSSSGNLPLDPVILQSILLCMTAGYKHLILHTPEEDVGLVVKLVVWTLSSVFDLPIHKVKVKSRSSKARDKNFIPPRDPNSFLRSLFLPSSRNDPFDQSRPSSRAKTRPGKRRTGLRSVSFPNDLSILAKSDVAGNADDFVDMELRDVSTPPSLPSSLVIKAPQPRPFQHAHTEPVPLRRDISDPEFPRALILSGLENASSAEQTALIRVLTERQVVLEAGASEQDANSVDRRRRQTSTYTQDSDTNPSSYNVPSENLSFEGTWNVPEDFIMIYVSRWDPRERPNINKSLLDHFAISSTIFVQPHIRKALTAFPFTYSNRDRHHTHSHSNPTTPSPLQSPPIPQARTPAVISRPPTHHRPHNSFRSSRSLPSLIVPKQLLPRDFIAHLQSAAESAHFSHNLSLYLSDLFSAVRHHPKLDGTFLTARSMNDAYAMARASRVLGTDPTGGELLRGFAGSDYSVDEEDGETADGGGSFHNYEDIASGSGSVTITITQEGRKQQSHSFMGHVDDHHRQVHDDAATTESLPEDTGPENLYVTEADIARIVPRIVTHRLRVRDGPEDEVLAGAVFGAAFQTPHENGDPSSIDTAGQHWDTRRTIKDILVEVLAEV